MGERVEMDDKWRSYQTILLVVSFSEYVFSV